VAPIRARQAVQTPEKYLMMSQSGVAIAGGDLLWTPILPARTSVYMIRLGSQLSTIHKLYAPTPQNGMHHVPVVAHVSQLVRDLASRREEDEEEDEDRSSYDGSDETKEVREGRTADGEFGRADFRPRKLRHPQLRARPIWIFHTA